MLYKDFLVRNGWSLNEEQDWRNKRKSVGRQEETNSPACSSESADADEEEAEADTALIKFGDGVVARGRSKYYYLVCFYIVCYQVCISISSHSFTRLFFEHFDPSFEQRFPVSTRIFEGLEIC